MSLGWCHWIFLIYRLWWLDVVTAFLIGGTGLWRAVAGCDSRQISFVSQNLTWSVISQAIKNRYKYKYNTFRAGGSSDLEDTGSFCLWNWSIMEWRVQVIVAGRMYIVHCTLNTYKSKNCLRDMSPYICPHILSSLLVVCIQCPTVQALMWTFQYFSVAIFTCGELCVRLSMWPFHVSHVWLCGGRVGSVSISRSKCGFSVLSPPDRSLLSLPPSYPPLSSYHPAQPLHLHQPLHPPNPTSMIIWSTFTCNIFCLVCLASSIGVGWRQAGGWLDICICWLR